MKILLLILIATALAEEFKLTPEEIEIFTDGFLAGLPVREDHKKLFKCLDEEVGASWTRVMNAIAKQEWDEPIKVYTAVIIILEPTIYTLQTLQDCSAGEVAVYINKIKETTHNREKFVRKINENISQLVKDLQAMVNSWKGKKYKELGKGTGRFINFLIMT